MAALDDSRPRMADLIAAGHGLAVIDSGLIR